MTDRQRQIARHMLGLGNAKRSYRNRYCAEPGHADFDTLLQMLDAGLVTSRRGIRPHISWHLTRAAAESVLLPGESLDPEDFPTKENDSDGL